MKISFKFRLETYFLLLILFVVLVFIYNPISSIKHTHIESCSRYYDSTCVGYNATIQVCRCIGLIHSDSFPGTEDMCLGVETSCQNTATIGNYIPIK